MSRKLALKVNIVVVVTGLVLFIESSAQLTICGSKICNQGKDLFLSGVNQAWQNYGSDFGNGKYTKAKASLEATLSVIRESGGNSVRIFLHTNAANTPEFSSAGYVTAADSHRNLIINEMKQYLDEAKKNGIFVFFVLWNFAHYDPIHSKKIAGLVTDDKKLKSYVDKALIPIVSGLKGHTALGGYDIANEPAGGIRVNQFGFNPCFNTIRLKSTGAGWWRNGDSSVPLFSMQRMLRFISWQAHAIKTTDSSALVTVGAWSQKIVHGLTSDSFSYYDDLCLLSAGGSTSFKGKLDFYQIHTYAGGGTYDAKSPMKICSSSHNLNKPIVIGEFSESGGDGRSIVTLFGHARRGGYAGAWSWHATATGKDSDSFETQKKGLKSLKTTSVARNPCTPRSTRPNTIIRRRGRSTL